MVEHTAVSADINSFDLDQRKVCSSCRAEAGNICKVAVMQKNLSRRPTTFDALREGVDVTRIPSTCPNGYKEPSVAEQL